MRTAQRVGSFVLASMGTAMLALSLLILSQSSAFSTVMPDGINYLGGCYVCTGGQCDDSNAFDCYSGTSCLGCSCQCYYYQAGQIGPYSTCACT